MPQLQELPTFQRLLHHHQQVASDRMADWFVQDPDRFPRMSIRLRDLLFDYSKHRVTGESLKLLVDLAREAGVEERRDEMYGGARLNFTEGRSVLHVALRNVSGSPMTCAGVDVMPEVRSVLRRMRAFVEALRDGTWRGHGGRRVTDIVNIGIGGSDLGPAMAAQALEADVSSDLRLHFVSNVDGAHLSGTLARLDPASTLFIVASKTFTTLETMQNARSARDWLVATLGDEAAVAKHFVAVSTNREKVQEFGIAAENVFEFWDWVGGRFSMWSAVGLSLACGIGFENFEAFLEGAHEADEHFRRAPMDENIPVIMALLGVWYADFFGASTHAVLPYSQSLARLPAFLQQLDMESNGKSVDRDGRRITLPSAPVVWGEPGTNGQHAFYQLLHQGTQLVPADLILFANSRFPEGDHQRLLLANGLAQAEALMVGRTEAQVRRELEANGLSGERLEALLPHKVFEGNRPTSVFLMDSLTPRALGRLLALYEHKIFVQGILWNVNSFDQWGVELGKALAGTIAEELSKARVGPHDASSAGLIAEVLARRRGHSEGA